MLYVFDFDRTVFDMEGLYRQIEFTNPDKELGTIESLNNIDLSKLLFADALDFFRSHDKTQIHILSSGHGKTGTWDPAYQAEKVGLSGVADWVGEVHIVASDKVAQLRSLWTQHKGELVFVDDHIDNIESVRAALPDILTVYIDRQCENSVAAGAPRITSLSELDAIIRV